MIQKTFRLFFTAVFLFALVSGCKDDIVVENNNNNNNEGPAAPVLIEPVNNTVVNGNTQLLKWSEFPNTITYRIQVSRDANFLSTAVIDTGTNATELTIREEILTPGIYYYWRVISMQNGNNSEWSAVWRFSIILPPPAAPQLSLPENISINQSFTPLFDWNDVFTAQVYRIQVSQSSNFTQNLIDSSRINISQFQCPPMLLNTGTQYYWRVQASNSNGISIGEWSQTFSFTTIAGPEPNSISGTITFVDGNFPSSNCYYRSAAYLPNAWPPLFIQHFAVDSLNIQFNNGVYSAAYKLKNLPNGTYFIASQLVSRAGGLLSIMGTYGCDTARTKFSNCPLSPAAVTISENNGVTGIDFLSWADSTKSIFSEQLRKQVKK